MRSIRNIAIIAHVDHGKTTLVDALLKQSANFSAEDGSASGGRAKFTDTTLIMDSNELERERGITIFSKNAAVNYGGMKINIVDTPGHADFGGEVERIMRMVDGALLLVDAKEGPMPQTRFVLKNAIKAGHKIILVINKIDKPDARPNWVLEKTFDLFVDLGASDEQAEFPVIYASGLEGRAGLGKDLSTMKDVRPLFDTIIKHIPAPNVEEGKPLQMLTVNLAPDNYKGKIAIGRLYSGTLAKNMRVAHINRKGEVMPATLSSVMVFDGLAKVETDKAEAGDIVAIAGIPEVSIGETIADLEHPIQLPVIEIEEPTVKMEFSVNNSPFCGREGKLVTSNDLRDRLLHEVETDVALRVNATDSADKWTVSGRGELHLAILIEKMRREGHEFQVSRPQVILKEINGKSHEPLERVFVEVPENFTGVVIEGLGRRKGIMMDMRVEGSASSISAKGGSASGGKGQTSSVALMEFLVPTRGLIGFRNQFITETKGLGIMNTLFEKYEPFMGELESNPHGSLIASETGMTRAYGLIGTQDRGEFFVGSGVDVYEGMVVGQNAKAMDLRVNVVREKNLTNFRSKNEGEVEYLKVPRVLTLEDSIEYIGDDELLEVTPKSLRIRKRYLTETEEKRAARNLTNS